jgi:hypothetical protein
MRKNSDRNAIKSQTESPSLRYHCCICNSKKKSELLNIILENSFPGIPIIRACPGKCSKEAIDTIIHRNRSKSLLKITGFGLKVAAILYS